MHTSRILLACLALGLLGCQSMPSNRTPSDMPNNNPTATSTDLYNSGG